MEEDHYRYIYREMLMYNKRLICFRGRFYIQQPKAPNKLVELNGGSAVYERIDSFYLKYGVFRRSNE